MQAIREMWYIPVFEHTMMKDFFKKILTVYNILDVFELNEHDTIALYGRNSPNWIAIYIACILKGVRLLIIHPNQKRLEIAHITVITNVNHIFIDNDLIFDDLGRNPFLLTLIEISSLSVIYEKNDKNYFKVLAEVLVSSEPVLNIDLRVLDTFDEEDEIDSSIITATSGVEHYTPKWVESTTGSITDLITKAIGIVPYDTLDRIFTRIEFSESHFVTVLLPFVKGCTFVGNQSNANVVIEGTNTIENIWKENVSYLYSKPILSFLFSISWMRWLFKKVAVLKMKSFYGKRVEKILIYNNVVNEDILSILVGKLPIYATYGSQETNQLVAINDFSSDKKRESGATGRALPGLSFNTFDDQLEISGTTLFDRYVGDDDYTREVRFRETYITGDIGVNDPVTNVLFVYGRKSAVHINDFKLPTQLDKLERIIKSIPYVKEVVLFHTKEDNKLILLVYPDVKFVETKRLGLIHLKELMNVYLKKINITLGDPTKIDEVIVLTEPLRKTPDGKICRYYYS